MIAIAGIEDRCLRNLRITECYHRLSSAMAERTGACANWCTFATWASRQAGCTIRGEDFLDLLADRLRPGWSLLHPAASLWRALLRQGIFNPKTFAGRVVRDVHTPFDAFERASEAVAAGNLKVFAEIGFEFARYLECCPSGAARDSQAFIAFTGSLRPGPPPEGQDLLRSAFTRYQQAAFEPANTRDQLILLANLEIGLHEQTRLQPEIRSALEAAPATAEDLASRGLFLYALRLVLWRYRRFAREVARLVITDALMVLELPDGTLRLGRHLTRSYPDGLLQLTYPALVDLCGRYEPGAECDDCGARDWAELRQRMHYIVHLFRAFHFDAGMIRPPFTAAQVEAMMAGRIPGGKL